MAKKETKTTDERLWNAIEKNGLLSFKDFERKFGKKPSEMLTEEYLKNNDLRVTRFEGEKVLALKNKTQTILAYLEVKGNIPNAAIYEINQWNSHVTGSVFRQSARDKFGIVKVGNSLATK